MIGRSRGMGVIALAWVAGASLAGCGGDSVDPSDGEAGAAGAVSGTGGSDGAGAAGGSAPSASGGTGAQGASGGTGATGGSGVSGTGGSGTGAAGETSAGAGGTSANIGGGAGSGAASGSGGGAGTPAGDGCSAVRAEYAAELARIQACTDASECGKALHGTSCGCTRDKVARLDADTTRFDELLRTRVDGEACFEFISTCDCPNADGYACNGGRCGWNYADQAAPRTCQPVPYHRMCVVGVPTEAGEVLLVGDRLRVEFHPSGCFSSSCSELATPSCRIQSLEDNTYMADASLQVCVIDDGRACTDDCGGPEPRTCDGTGVRVLGEGAHEVTLRGAFGLSVAFEVPSTIPAGGLCVEIPAPPEP